MMALNSDLLEMFRMNTEWDEDTRCWLWIGPQHNFGYGNCPTNGFGTRLAHRLSWMMHKGPIRNGLHVCHKCDVPECVNPDHLFLGTAKENIHDMIFKGRRVVVPQKTHCIKGHLFDKIDRLSGKKTCNRCRSDTVLRYKSRNLEKVRLYQREHAKAKRREKCLSG